MRIVLFDIDGTLLLTGGAGLRSLESVFRREHGVSAATEGIEFHGCTDREILRSIARKRLRRDLEDAELHELERAYVSDLEETLARDASRMRVLPGARDVVSALHARADVVLGLATGNFERAAWAKLAQAGLDGFFGLGGFGSDSEDRQELTRTAVSRARESAGAEAPVLLVGDTVRDVRCAAGAGADCLGVATGPASEAELREAGARWTVPSLADPGAPRILGLEAP